MSLTKDVHKALENIGSVSMTTLDETVSGRQIMHSRIISICGSCFQVCPNDAIEFSEPL